MLSTLQNKNLATFVASLAAILFVIMFGACTDEHFITEDKGGNVTISGDTLISFNDFRLVEKDWAYSNGLAAANDHYFDGYVEYKVDGQIVKTDLIEHETAAMSIEWAPIKEDTAAIAEKMYLESIAGEAKFVKNHVNQKVNFDKYERECVIKFVGMEVTLKGTWYEASLGNNSKAVGCRYEKTTIATQDPDTAMVNGVKEEIEIKGKKYNRVTMTAKAENHFTDLPSGESHTEAMDIVYNVLVPVNFVPGEKIYQGSSSVEGTGIYTKVSDTEYKSQIDLTHYFIQDGKTSTEQETVSGIASVKTWVEGDNTPKIWSSNNIGNPAVSVNTSISENYYQKEGNIYAKMYKTVWTYTWSDANTGESFRKEVHSEVERLYYMRETGKAVAMPFGETSSSYAGFNAGAAVIKTQNNKEYEAYSGQISFNGNHKSTTGNLNDAISDLVAPQEIWVEVVKEDEFLGFDKKVIKGDNNNASQIIITEHWSISGDKEITFTQSANYSFSVSEQQRVLGENLTFVSGLSKSTDNPKFNEVKEGQFARTITSTYVAKFNLCEVKAIAKATEAYVEYRNEKINFEFAETSVEYKGINNPTATEVEADGKLYSRLAYEVSFAHSVLGTKNASVLVDKEIELTQTTPDEWGKLDIAKTKAFGGLSWSWKSEGNKLVPFVTGTIVTEYGVVSFWEGGSCFNKMNTSAITERLGNALKAEGPEYLVPTYIKILTDPNKHWGYQDVNGQYRAEINGVDIELLPNVSLDKPFIAEGGNADVYKINDNRVVITYNGNVIFNEVFAK